MEKCYLNFYLFDRLIEKERKGKRIHTYTRVRGGSRKLRQNDGV